MPLRRDPDDKVEVLARVDEDLTRHARCGGYESVQTRIARVTRYVCESAYKDEDALAAATEEQLLVTNLVTEVLEQELSEQLENLRYDIVYDEHGFDLFGTWNVSDLAF